MPRRARLDAPGTLHHVIVRGIERRKIVDDEHDRQVFVDWKKLTFELIEQHGLTPAEAARQLGVTISAISKMMSRVQRSNDST